MLEKSYAFPYGNDFFIRTKAFEWFKYLENGANWLKDGPWVEVGDEPPKRL